MQTLNELLLDNKKVSLDGGLSLQKRTVTELTDDEMFQIDGGTSPITALASTLLCAATVLVSVIAVTCTPGM